jgi:hypothetical protein
MNVDGNMDVEGDMDVEGKLDIDGDLAVGGQFGIGILEITEALILPSPAEFPQVNPAIGAFDKADPMKPAWEKDGNFVVKTSQTLTIDVNNKVYKIPSSTSITMPLSAVVGQDYAVWIDPDGDLFASENFTVTGDVPANSRKLGGFHYAPGGNAAQQVNAGGGNTTAQINEYSFYDLKWKPSVPDPRGLTLVNEAFWTGIYFLAQNHLSGAPHRYNVNIAKDGQNPDHPFLSGSYPDSNWWNIGESLQYHGFRYPNPNEFQMLAVGATENANRGNDPVKTGIGTANTGSTNTDEKFTSTWGVIQAVGVVNIWGMEIRVDNTDQTTTGLQNRGGLNRFGRAVIFGGRWNDSLSGSRHTRSDAPSTSVTSISGRGVCNHLVIP